MPSLNHDLAERRIENFPAVENTRCLSAAQAKPDQLFPAQNWLTGLKAWPLLDGGPSRPAEGPRHYNIRSSYGGCALRRETVLDDLRSVENPKPCAYCGSPITVKAILCPVCKSYQSPWRTALIYIAGIAGLIGIMGSAFAYIISEVPSIHKIIAWHDDIKIWNFVGSQSTTRM